jgi:hypothetical protein
MLRTGRLPAPHRGRSSPASTSRSRPTPGVLLPGTLASPRTGLTPAGCRELVAQLRRGALLSVVLGARATGRTFPRNRLGWVLAAGRLGSGRPRGGGVDAGPCRPGSGQGPPQAVLQGRKAPLPRPGGGVGCGRVAATTAGPRPGAGARTRRRRYASGWSWRSSCIRLQTSVPSAQMYGSTLAANSRAGARSTPSSSAHRSNDAAIGRPKSASCQVPTAVEYSNTYSRNEARGPPPVTPMRPGYLHLGTRRNDPTAHSPTVSAADTPTSPGCAPGSEPTHRRSELRSPADMLAAAPLKRPVRVAR